MYKPLIFIVFLCAESASAASPLNGCWETMISFSKNENEKSESRIARFVFYQDVNHADTLFILPIGSADGEVFLTDISCSKQACQLIEDGGGFEVVQKRNRFWLKTDRLWTLDSEQLPKLIPSPKAIAVTTVLKPMSHKACVQFKKDLAAASK